MAEPPSITAVCDADTSVGTWILMQFSNPRREDHHQLRAVLVRISHEIIHHNLNLSPTPPAYLAATCYSLRLLSESTAPFITDAHLIILSLVIRKVSPPKPHGGTQIRFSVFAPCSPLAREVFVGDFRVIRDSVSLAFTLHYEKRINDSNSAAVFSELYGCLLSFATFFTFEIRRQVWSCLRDLLRHFQGTMLIESASETLFRLFMQWFPCAEAIAVGSTERLQTRQGMCVLDVLVECLFLMSTKHKLAILEDYKTILELLRHKVTTRRITNCLRNLFGNSQSLDVPPELLLELLSLLAQSVYKNESNEHDPKFTARLLNIGMARVYSSNRQICVMKLPLVFNALKGIMAQTSSMDGHAYVSKQDVRENQMSAAYSFRCLIHACIDTSLIKEGMPQIVLRTNQPSIIEQVCFTIESLLGHQYIAIWDLAFEIVSTMFEKLGEYSSYFMEGSINYLADMQKLTDEEFRFRKQMHECLGSALVAMRPEKFLGFLPLNLESEDPSEVNDWLFQILTKYTIGAKLSFYTNSILVKIGMMREKSRKLRLQGLPRYNKLRIHLYILCGCCYLHFATSLLILLNVSRI